MSKLDELRNLCDNLGMIYTEDEQTFQIVMGNQEVSISKDTMTTDSEVYYPTIESIIKTIEEW